MITARVPVRASRADGYQCNADGCAEVLHLVGGSETGADFICLAGHGWLHYFAWGFDGQPRWVRSDVLYARFGPEYERNFPERIPQ